jgi:phage terminase small subunit
MLSFSAASFAQIGISVRFGPPAIPIYAQPLCPGPGYFWTPGYWAWNDAYGYYWVPGTWVFAPVGMLWTPGYWGWYGGFYRWHPGYWGRHVGFYGGVNYGYGYNGFGFWGGEWRGRRFYYNRSVTNINVVNVTNVYERNVVVRNNSRVSYNGGEGGINVRPTREEERFEREPHREALNEQMHHERAASENRQLFASENHGRPAIAATDRPGEFHGRNVVEAREAGERYREPKISPREARVPENEARGTEGRKDVPRPGNRNEGNRDSAGNDRWRNNGRGQAQQEKAAAHREQQQAKQERQRVQQEQKAQRKEAQQEQKRQRQEQKRAAHEGRGPGR